MSFPVVLSKLIHAYLRVTPKVAINVPNIFTLQRMPKREGLYTSVSSRLNGPSLPSLRELIIL